MYTESSYLQSFFENFSLPSPAMSPLIAQLQEHQLGMPLAGHLPGVSSPPGNLVQPSAIFEYDFGDEGDLFKAPEPITEETLLAIDPMSGGVSIVAGGDDVIINTIKVAEAIQNEMQSNALLSEVFYECKKDLLEKCAISESVLDPSPLPIPAAEDLCCWDGGRVAAEASLNKSFSAGCLDSREWISYAGRPNFLEFQGLDFEAAYGMRRAYSEGDIEKLENTAASFGGTNDARSSLEQLVAMGEFKSEDRRQKLSRYMKKKTKRNFGRKIKYACRKALADCQPRVRGRFAKIDECGSYKQKK